MTVNTTQSWQKFLAPIVAAIVALCGACGSYLKSHSEISDKHDIEISERVKLEMIVKQNAEDITVLKADNALMKSTLYNISNDVSFIRGRLEGRNNE